ncbi:unnamed protein product [Pleuronectes platessa]|uniref:Uncharacterized protein n=1 Tax=Pleuronectes platessa TaxID=8262 RepID=A0A9N7W4H0_PLEPL|nr:unnamed protein product [Pleuronectes platessa]
MYCERAAWGRAARARRHPPTLPESAVSVATRVEGGGGRRSVKVKRQTFESRWEGYEDMKVKLGLHCWEYFIMRLRTLTCLCGWCQAPAHSALLLAPSLRDKQQLCLRCLSHSAFHTYCSVSLLKCGYRQPWLRKEQKNSEQVNRDEVHSFQSVSSCLPFESSTSGFYSLISRTLIPHCHWDKEA